MLDDGKLGTILAAAGVVFIVFFAIFMWLFGWGFYVSSALGAIAAVTMIWWMGIEDAEMIDDEAGQGRPVTRPLEESTDDDPPPIDAKEPVPTQHVEAEDATDRIHAVDAGADIGSTPPPDESSTAEVQPIRPEATEAEPAASSHGAPPALLEAPEGEPDDLTRIKGIGPKLQEMLNGMGVWHFRQIAGWSETELDWVDANLEGFKGRARRDNWVGQAKDLA